MARWKRIEKLADDLAAMRQTKYRKFNMARFLTPITWEEDGFYPTISKLRKNGPECGTAACIAGWITIFHAPARDTPNQAYCDTFAEEYLGLDLNESAHMFYGHWHPSGTANSQITKAEAVRYLRKVVKEKNVFVKL